MKNIFALLILFSTIFNACNIDDRINYTSDENTEGESIKNSLVASNIQKGNDYFYEVEFNFPKLPTDGKTVSEEIAENFNSKIKEYVDTKQKEYKGSALKEKKNIVDLIIEEDSLTPAENHMKYTLNLTYTANKTNNKILSIKFIEDRFDLGTHGNLYFKAFNYDLNEGKFLSIEDFLNVKNETSIKAIDQILLNYFDDGQDCFDIKPSIRNDNMEFSVTEENAVFSFPPYALGAYTCGAAVILVPIKEFKERALWKK